MCVLRRVWRQEILEICVWSHVIKEKEINMNVITIGVYSARKRKDTANEKAPILEVFFLLQIQVGAWEKAVIQYVWQCCRTAIHHQKTFSYDWFASGHNYVWLFVALRGTLPPFFFLYFSSGPALLYLHYGETPVLYFDEDSNGNAQTPGEESR